MVDNLKNKQVQKALKFDWRPWLKRDFFAFIISTFKDGNSKQAFKKVGLPGWEYISFMFDDGQWYWSDDVCRLAEPQAIAWLKKHRISELTDRLENFYVKNKKKVIKLATNPEINTQAKLKELQSILAENSTYVWIAHLLEDYISAALQAKVKKYIKRDAENLSATPHIPIRKINWSRWRLR